MVTLRYELSISWGALWVLVVLLPTGSTAAQDASQSPAIVDQRLATALSYEVVGKPYTQEEDGSVVIHRDPETIVYRGATVERDEKGFTTITAETVELYIDHNDGNGDQLVKTIDHPQKPTRLPPAGVTPFGVISDLVFEGHPVCFEWSVVDQDDAADEPRLTGVLGSKDERIGDVLGHIVSQVPNELRWVTISEIPWLLPAQGQAVESDLDEELALGIDHESAWDAIKEVTTTANSAGTHIHVNTGFLLGLSSPPRAFVEEQTIDIPPGSRTVRELLSMIAYQSPVAVAYRYTNSFSTGKDKASTVRQGVLMIEVFERGKKPGKTRDNRMTPDECGWWEQELAQASNPW